jgi:PIN domain nuclease of toxin-antitoxin system
MKIICDTHALLFWADAPERLTDTAREAMIQGKESGTLACSDISFWEIAMLFERERLNSKAGISPDAYMRDIVLDLNLTILPITPEITLLSRTGPFLHKDPADRLIAATALHYRAPLITADAKLQDIPELRIIW